MRWLIDRVRAAWLALQVTEQRPARVGLLNTGELVLIDSLGQPLVFSTDTTGLMREALQPDFNQLFIELKGSVGQTD